jgi:hypothetical protein
MRDETMAVAADVRHPEEDVGAATTIERREGKR